MNNYPAFQGVDGIGDWDGHYDDPDGFDKVEARRAVYDLIGEGVKIVDWDQQVIELLGSLGLSKEIEFADVGCSFPHLLKKMANAGYTGANRGPLYGVEPNTRQLGRLAYWEPIDEEPTTSDLMNMRLAEGELLEGIKLVRASAQELPFGNSELDLVTLMFSAYHIPQNKQERAFDEIKRVLSDSGILLLATSGNDNKKGMRENELKIADCLSGMLNTDVVAPEPLNSGFTSEKAVDVLTNKFNNVARFYHPFRIIISSEQRLRVMLGAYRSLIDMYTYSDNEGQRKYISSDMFDRALEKVVVDQVNKSADRGEFVTDTAVQDLFVASDSVLILPAEYKVLKAES